MNPVRSSFILHLSSSTKARLLLHSSDQVPYRCLDEAFTAASDESIARGENYFSTGTESKLWTYAGDDVYLVMVLREAM